MALAFGRTLGATNSKTANQASTTLTTTGALNSGELGVLIIAVDDNSGANGDEVAVSSVTDGAGNTWTKAKENTFTTSVGVPQGGIVCSVWWTNATATLASSGVITVNFNNSASRDASALSAAAFTKTGNAAVEGTPTSLGENADPSALDCTTSNISCVRIRAIGMETNSTTALTKTAAFTGTFSESATTGGAATTNVAVRGEYAVTTGTGLSSNPSMVAGADVSSIYVAFKESGGVSASVTGNQSTGAAGTPTVSGKAIVTITGNSSTGAAGTPTVTLNLNVPITGNSSTGDVNTVTVSAKVNTTPTGVSSTGAAGTPTVSGKAVVSITGNSSTGSAGTPTVSGKAVVSITGNSSTGAAGDVTVTIGGGAPVSVTANLTGVSSTGSAGTVTVSGKATVNTTGVSSSVSVGDLSVSGKANVTITGNQSTAGVGTPTVSFGIRVTIDGVESTGRAGTVTATGFEEVLGKPFTFERRKIYSNRLPIFARLR